MSKFISFAVLLDQVKSMKDRSLKITFVTSRELAPEQGSILLALANQEGYAYFSSSALQESQLVVPDVVPEFPTDKSPSVRLRNSLWRLWEQQGKQGEFDSWYKHRMELIIEQIKEKLT